MHAALEVAAAEEAKARAYELILGAGKEVFDLSKEKPALRDRYGRFTFGQDCLAARRMVEAGVPYVVINYPGGWDTHSNHFATMRRQCPQLDQGLATLLADLKDRGLLDTTIVWCTGEFGRTPKVDYQPPWNGGRNHHGNVFTVLVAGGGFKRRRTSSVRPMPRRMTSRIVPYIRSTCSAVSTNWPASMPTPNCPIRWEPRPTCCLSPRRR